MNYWKVILLGALATLTLLSHSHASTAQKVRVVYSPSAPVTTSAYTELFASTAQPVNRISVFDSSGQTLVLAVGLASGASTAIIDQILIPPGGGDFPLNISQASQVWIKAVSANATTGELDLNLFFD